MATAKRRLLTTHLAQLNILKGQKNPLFDLSNIQAWTIDDKGGDSGTVVGEGVLFDEFLGGTMTVKTS
jgi:hypothetical protein